MVERLFAAELNDVIAAPTQLGDAQIVAKIENISYARNSISPDQETLFRQYLGYQLDQELLEAFVIAIRDDLGVKVNQAQLDAIFADFQ